MTEWRPIKTARFVEEGVVAVIRLEGGSVRKVIWEERHHAIAWWPLEGDGDLAGLYTPVEWRLVSGPEPAAHDSCP